METVYEISRIKQVGRKKKWKFEFDYQVRNPETAARIAQHFIGDEDREVFFVMCLNTKNKIIAVHRAHVGSINATVVHPREIFKCAILNNACSLIFFHNHPSNDCSPSQEDIEVTKRLVECGKILGVEVVDHIIVGDRKFLSLKDRGHM